VPKTDVTIIMSPREQFGFTKRSVESLYSDQNIPFDFICIDGGSPQEVRDYLRSESERRGFKLIRKPYFLTPNEARNLVLDEIKTRYVVFIDNDVVFAPMWLTHLLQCAEETGAAIVTPLVCIGEPVHTKIHMAGADASITVRDGKRVFHETHHFLDSLVTEVGEQLIRKPVELAEFHCMLVKTEVIKKLGKFDENLKSTSEHTDFCLTVREQGGTIMIEPRAVVTQIFGLPISWSDLKFFFCRWSDEWTIDSERYFHKKWNTVFDESVLKYFVRPRRRHAFPKVCRVLQAIVGWRISGWLIDRVAEVFVWSAKRDRAAALGHS